MGQNLIKLFQSTLDHHLGIYFFSGMWYDTICGFLQIQMKERAVLRAYTLYLYKCMYMQV